MLANEYTRAVSRGPSGLSSEPDPKWEAFAAREPYFAVLAAPKFLRANFTDAHASEFFGSGEALVDWMLRTIDLRLVPQFTPVSVLEYGCGVGRLVLPFARRVGSVTAVDRSPTMLGVARSQVVKNSGTGDVKFLKPNELFAESRKFDLVNCYLVFQRMAQDEGLALFERLLGCLGAGGIGVFQFPYRTTTPRVVDAVRWMRERVPGVNAIANVVRGKSFADPAMVTHCYDLDNVLTLLHDASISETYVALEQQTGLAGAVFFVQAPSSFTPLKPQSETVPIDVDRVIAGTSVEELNRAAEQYFLSLSDWDYHLSKPFSTPDETPPLLTDVAVLIDALQLTAGATVLEFGAGTGWLSRFLTQLGARVILLDVSPTALTIARELYRRQPVIGDKSTPEFLQSDGRCIPLPDESVDRIVSFHAFHHAPDPDSVLREFGRVLKPGGLAVFVEPGPRHSTTPQSQFEMRTHGVIENDIDVHDVWRTAQGAGFSDLKLAVFHTPRFHLSLEDYEDFLAGGSTCAGWVTSTRGFLRHVRTFVLSKSASNRVDSRAARALAADIRLAATHIRVTSGESIAIDAVVKNSDQATWLPSDVPHGGVLLGGHVYDGAGKLLSFDAAAARLTDPPREIRPGEAVPVRLILSPQPVGRYIVELDCVASRVTWFAQVGSPTVRLTLDVVGPTDSAAGR